MKKSHNNVTAAEILRQKAEKLLQKKTTKVLSKQSDEEKLKLIHELAVHQIELEMQNNDLILAKKEVDAANKNYEELFNFTPACYYTLSREGDILSLNNSGAHMLGKAPNRLIIGFEITDIIKKENETWKDGYFTKPYNKTSLLKMIKKNFK